MDAGVDMGTEDMAFAGDFLLSSMAESSLSVGNIPVLDILLNEGGAIAGDFSDNANIL